MTDREAAFLEPLMDRFHVRSPEELLDVALEFFAETAVQERFEEALFFGRCAWELVRLAGLSP